MGYNPTCYGLALELGVSQKTLWGWKTDRWQPSILLKARIGVGLTL
jgi:DNA-binding XRE family transcriptional regulator